MDYLFIKCEIIKFVNIEKMSLLYLNNNNLNLSPTKATRLRDPLPSPNMQLTVGVGGHTLTGEIQFNYEKEPAS